MPKNPIIFSDGLLKFIGETELRAFTQKDCGEQVKIYEEARKNLPKDLTFTEKPLARTYFTFRIRDAKRADRAEFSLQLSRGLADKYFRDARA